ncbi:hypothetical protein N1851_025498 [Merluccius polli]|uniref:Uncharacterized protein n=1 Tax=Merluccius polli TaxID=89951 RepID=A0AA47NW25_MERPO|nr:hypothetical protein N1851_026297 [Merluccius polli]KAK0138187.1 hypothetical protein N1851_025498 [Merluccius polli]
MLNEREENISPHPEEGDEEEYDGHVAERGRSLQNRIRTALRSRLTDYLEPSRYVFLEMTSLRKAVFNTICIVCIISQINIFISICFSKPQCFLDCGISAILFFRLISVKPLHPGTDWDLLPTDLDQALLSRLDYCNSLLAGLPASAIKPLQRIQTAAARLVFNLPKSSHVTPLFRDLQRLPVAARITFKTTVPTYKAVNGTAPTHLRALVRPTPRLEPSARLPRPAGRYRHP